MKYVRMFTIVDSARTRLLACLVNIKDQCVLIQRRRKIARNGIFRQSAACRENQLRRDGLNRSLRLLKMLKTKMPKKNCWIS